MSENQRKALVDTLKTRLSSPELKSLVYIVLGAGAYDQLGGDNHIDKCLNFVEEAIRKEKLPSLVSNLIEVREDIDFSFLDIPPIHQEHPHKHDSAPFLPFTNRKSELERIVTYPTPMVRYYLIQAPAGYGKTALLKKVQEEFQRQDWFCVYISLEECPTVFDIVSKLKHLLSVKAKVYQDHPRLTGVEIGKAIAQKHDKEKGIVLLFDADHAFQDSSEPITDSPEKSITGTLIKEFICGIWDGLIRNSEFFTEVSDNYRAIVAGRSLFATIHNLNLNYRFEKISLRTFDYDVVKDICLAELLGGLIQSETEAREFAAHLLFSSGGHPQCIANIISEFKSIGYSPSDFLIQYDKKIKEIVCNEAIWIRNTIPPAWRKIFDTLCVFRRFDMELLERLLQDGPIWPGEITDVYDLVDKLTKFYLFDWKTNKHLGDDIVMRIWVTYLRNEIPEERFQALCNQAKQYCLDRLKSSHEYNVYWAIEVLFHFLQANVAQINDPEKRRIIREQFLNDELPFVLDLLIAGHDPRSEHIPFKNALAEDWEFRFVVNFYLREDTYDDGSKGSERDNSIYKRVMTQIDDFFKQASDAKK